MPSLPENETALEDLQRRVARANVWRYVFLLLMPVGFIVPCVIGIALGKSNPVPVLASALSSFPDDAAGECCCASPA